MFAVQNLARTAPKLLQGAGNQSRTIVSTPPMVRVSFAEKCVLGALTWLGIMGPSILISSEYLKLRAKKAG